MKVLVIEDEKTVIDTITLCFLVGWPGASVISADDGLKGLKLVASESPDIVILDIGLPDISGYEVLHRIREFSPVPVIVLTAMNEENDIIRCLEWGADDFITKPFSKMELLARVKTKIRRNIPADDSNPVVLGELRYEPASNSFYYAGHELNLTLTEAEILYQLMIEAGNVVRHSTLARSVWGEEGNSYAGSLKVHIHHLREKLREYASDHNDSHIIQTWTGLGYSLEIPGTGDTE